MESAFRTFGPDEEVALLAELAATTRLQHPRLVLFLGVAYDPRTYAPVSLLTERLETSHDSLARRGAFLEPAEVFSIGATWREPGLPARPLAAHREDEQQHHDAANRGRCRATGSNHNSSGRRRSRRRRRRPSYTATCRLGTYRGPARPRQASEPRPRARPRPRAALRRRRLLRSSRRTTAIAACCGCGAGDGGVQIQQSSSSAGDGDGDGETAAGAGQQCGRPHSAGGSDAIERPGFAPPRTSTVWACCWCSSARRSAPSWPSTPRGGRAGRPRRRDGARCQGADGVLPAVPPRRAALAAEALSELQRLALRRGPGLFPDRTPLRTTWTVAVGGGGRDRLCRRRRHGADGERGHALPYLRWCHADFDDGGADAEAEQQSTAADRAAVPVADVGLFGRLAVLDAITKETRSPKQLRLVQARLESERDRWRRRLTRGPPPRGASTVSTARYATNERTHARTHARTNKRTNETRNDLTDGLSCRLTVCVRYSLVHLP